jgi:uncharacterized protein
MHLRNYSFFLLIFLIQIVSGSCHPGVSTKQLQKEIDSTNFHKSPSSLSTDSIPKPFGYVNDFEKLYTSEQQAYLSKIIAAFEDSTTIQLAIVTLDTTMTSSKYFDDYTLRLANSWGVGQNDKNNGIVVCISSGLRQMRIQNGYGIEHIMTNEETKQIIDKGFIPAFKNGSYYEGTLKGLEMMFDLLKKRAPKR